MANKNMSALDAFIALEDLDDSILVMPKKPLKEGRAFNVRDNQQMEEAEKFINETNEKPLELEVVDPNAESDEDIKENKEYLGKIAIKCSSCGYVRLIDLEELQKTDQEGDDGKPIYNPDLECLQCHQTGSGYTLVGPVSAVPQEEETPIENDSLTNELKFDNEIEPEETEETGAKEPEEEVEAEEENNPDEVAEDDTADMENTFGNDFSGDDVSADDTVEQEEKPTENDSLTNDKPDEGDPDLKEISFEDEEDEKKKDESLNEEDEFIESIEIVPTKVSELLHLFIEPDSIKEITVYDLDSDTPEKEIYKGSFNEIPQSILEANLASYSSGEGSLIIRASSPQKDARTVEQVLGLFDDDFNGDINIIDATTDEELASGTPLSCISDAGQNTFEAFEAPSVLELKIRAAALPEEQKEDYAEAFDGTSDEDRLIENVLKENKFKTYRAGVYGTNEYWLVESIRNKEDLEIIFENFIKDHDYLIKDFKKVTGFKEALDLLVEEKSNPGKQISQDEAIEAAKQKLKENPKLKAVLYGYFKDGQFKSLPDGNLMEIETDKELRWASELVDRDYKPTGSLRILYRNSIEEKLDFKTRKELTEAILDCQKNNINYTVSRSEKEGYRYTLIKESVKFDEENEDKRLHRVIGENAEESAVVFEGTYEECEKYIEEAEREDAENYGADNPDTYEYFIECLGESLKEAAKDEELPADPEAVKTNVHSVLNTLVADEIEAIDGYEEAKQEIIDSPIEHKDELLDTVDHIEDEEKEHVDELIDASKEIPFEKEEGVKEPEAEPEAEEEVEFDETAFEGFVNDKTGKQFKTREGYINDKNQYIIEGVLIDGRTEVPTTFTIQPDDARKSFTICSECLTEELTWEK